MTSHLLACATLTGLLIGNPVQAEEPLKSGPPVGSENDRNGFRPQFVAGLAAGSRLCPV